ncbi:MAG TPA: response regulator transcription factor [Blastocatellia bacterium]|nr:response regulator transcription factor [Blastocatellia bacterium]
MNRILVVDDDLDLCELLARYLRREGFDVDMVHDGSQGLDRALSGEYALVVLDVMLPELNGFEALARLRARSSLPVLMLTARGDDIDRIVGLEMGADDYLPKPFNPRELIARIRAILRRARPEAGEATSDTPERIAVGDVDLDKGTRRVTRAGEEVLLTAVEFDLLEALLRSAGHIVSREELVESILGRKFSPSDRSIDTHISNLRRKLGHTTDVSERIRTIRSIGYIYAKPGDAPRE